MPAQHWFVVKVKFGFVIYVGPQEAPPPRTELLSTHRTVGAAHAAWVAEDKKGKK